MASCRPSNGVFLMTLLMLPLFTSCQTIEGSGEDPDTLTNRSGLPLNVNGTLFDPFDLDELVQKPRLLGNLAVGWLAGHPVETSTIKKLLRIAQSGGKGLPTLDLTVQLIRGYFNTLPGVLDSDGPPGAVLSIANAIQNDLGRAVVANYRDPTARKFQTMNETEQSLFLMSNIDWTRVVMHASLKPENADKLTIGPLTEMAAIGALYQLRAMLDTPFGAAKAAGVLHLVEAELDEQVKVSNSNPNISLRFNNLDTQGRISVLLSNFRVSRVISPLLIGLDYESMQPDGVNDTCYADAIHLLRNTFTGTRWALEMLDAFGKIPRGVSIGNINWIGEYDQCFSLSADRMNLRTGEVIDKAVFEGSYCDISIKLPEDLGIPAPPGEKPALKWGLCFPSTCNSTDVKIIMENLELGGNKLPEILRSRCHNEAPLVTGKFATDKVAHAAAALLGFFIVLVILCTVIEGCCWYTPERSSRETPKPNKKLVKTYEIGQHNDAYRSDNGSSYYTDIEMENIHVNGNGKANGKAGGKIANAFEEQVKSPKKDSTSKSLIKAFSIYSNLPTLLDTTERKGSLKSLDAFRFFSMQWIVVGHCFSIGAVFISDTLSNTALAANDIKNASFQGIYSAMLSVDTFFLLSGLLVSYLFLKQCEKSKGSRAWFMQMILYYAHRIIRLTPLYAVLIFVYAAFGQYLGSGPLFDWQNPRVSSCTNNWWTNLLYINNFVNYKEMCVSWSWYLANDMQFYVVAPIIMIPLYLNQIVGYLVLAAFFIAHWIITAYFWSGTEGNSFMQDPDIYYEAYITPYCRIGPYLVGLLLGHIFYKDFRIRSKIAVGGWWLVSLLMMGVVVYVQYEDVKVGGVQTPAWNVVQRTAYEALSRTAWAIACAWIIYACNYGYAGVIGHFLNWRGWAPLGKLTYAAYLVHPLVIFIYLGNRRDLNHLDNFSIAYMYTGYVTLSYLGGACLSLVFEFPFASLEKIIFAPLKKPKSS